jgi:hypothetical protein
MKKLALFLAMGAMIVGGASQAFALTSADFQGSLTRVVTDPTQLELYTDLGKSSTVALDTQISNGGFALSDFNVGTAWSQVNLSYFSNYMVKTGALPTSPYQYDIYFASTNANLTMTGVNTSQTSAFNSAAGSVYGQMALGGVMGSTSAILPSNPNSFTSKFGTTGSFTNLLNDGTSGKVNLAAFDAAGIQTVDMYLYHITKLGTSAWSMVGANGENYAYVITTSEAGYTTVKTAGSTSPVPVPAAAWLLISGLLGIIGARRKNS